MACFLRAELSSERYGEKLRRLLIRDGLALDLLARPDIRDPEANTYRRRLLDEHRGFGQRIGLFDGFPAHVDWYRASVARDEVLEIRYINWDWWLMVSAGTRSPVDAARRIRDGEIEGVTAEEHAELARALRSPSPPPELIVVTKPAHTVLVLVEGHVRLTAYALFPEFLPDELELYVGVADDMDVWTEF